MDDSDVCRSAPSLCSATFTIVVSRIDMIAPRTTTTARRLSAGSNPLAAASGPLPFLAMPDIATTTLANGLPVHRVRIPGTRALTVLVAFDAGARTERPEENG